MKEVLTDVSFGIILITPLILFHKFVFENLFIVIMVSVIFAINFSIIYLHERRYGKKNFPYKKYNNKKSILQRVMLGILAGWHYQFFIGNYNHKKYNTQVWYPETLECYFGNISQLIIFILYVFIAVKIYTTNLYYAIAFMLIPIITNIISLIKFDIKI